MGKFVKITILLSMGVFLNAWVSQAEKRYVSDNLVIMMRTGPAGDRKIIAQPRVGTPLELVKPGKDYSEVRTPSGRQGWVLTRYLSEKKPDRLVLSQLKEEHANVVEKYNTLRQQVTELDTTSKGLSGDLTTTKQAFENLTVEHETLKRESQGFLELKTKYQKAVKEAAQLRAKADELDKKYQQLDSSEMNTGLIYGGGLIVFGFIVGFIMKKPRRRTGLM